jgi:hypothetical protein
MFVLEEVISDSDFDALIPLLWHSYSQPRIPLLPLLFPVDEENVSVAILMTNHIHHANHAFFPNSRMVASAQYKIPKISFYKRIMQIQPATG